MELDAFQACINAAIADLPEHIRTHLDDVAVVVESRPKRRMKGLLLGLYEGIPATEWGRDFNGSLPDKITLYKEHIESYAETDDKIPHIIR